jgi:hypothetical protein
LSGEVNATDHLSACPAADISPPKDWIDMLDGNEEITSIGEHGRLRDYLVSIAFFGVAATAMIAWIAAIGWAGWRLIFRLF